METPFEFILIGWMVYTYGRISMNCPKCDHENRDDALFCNKCGISLQSLSSKNCPHCGNENSSEAKFCNKCGLSLEMPNLQKSQEKSEKKMIENESGLGRWIIGLLFLLSGLSYLIKGNILLSVIYLIIAIVLIPPIAKIVENMFNVSLSKTAKYIIIIYIFIIICSYIGVILGNHVIPVSKFSASPSATYAYITNDRDGTVSVIDTATSTLVDTVHVGNSPWGVAVSADGTKVYVTNHDSNNVSIINAENDIVTATVPVGSSPWGIAVNPAGTKVYVANIGSNNVSVIDTATNTVTATVLVGQSPNGIAVTPDGTKVYVTNGNSGTVSVIDTATNTVTATVDISSSKVIYTYTNNNFTGVSFGTRPGGIAVNPTGTKVYVANQESNTVSVIDTAKNTVIATVTVGKSPMKVAVDPTGTKVYVANQLDDVSVIDTTTNTVTDTLDVGNRSMGIAVNPTGTEVYVTGNNVSVISTGTNKVFATIHAGYWPMEVAIKPAPTLNVQSYSHLATYAYKANELNISKLDNMANTTVIGRLVVQLDPYVKDLNENEINTPDGKIWINENKITPETYFGQSAMHEIVLGQPVAEAGFKYNIYLLDWTADGHAPENNINTEKIVPANESTTDILVDSTGDISIQINGSQAIYQIKRKAIDSAGHSYTLNWVIDKENKVIRLYDVDQLKNAKFPVHIK
jgi:YVTN family beta-propeller protein